jgi:hypothetical protein
MRKAKQILRSRFLLKGAHISRVALLTSLKLIWCVAPTAASSQNAGTSASSEAQNCAALMQLNLEDAPRRPALIPSARLAAAARDSPNLTP